MFRKKSLVVLVFILSGLGIYFTYAQKVYKPEQFKYFSLIDDGQEIDNAYAIDSCLQGTGCKKAINALVETKFGRLRPVYWLIQWLNINTFGLKADLQHMFRVYLYGGLIILGWLYLSVKLKVNKVVGIILMMCLISSMTFTENILRLGPIEPYLLLILISVAIMYLNRVSYSIIGFTVLIATLTKETGLASFLPFLLDGKDLKKISKKWLGMFFVVSILTLLIYKAGFVDKSSPLAYSLNYKLDISLLINSTSGFLETVYKQNRSLTIIGFASLIFMFFYQAKNKSRLKKHVWLVMLVIFNFAILVPWSIVLDRYVLPLIFFLYLLFAIALTQTWNTLQQLYKANVAVKLVVGGFSLIALINLLSSDFITSWAKAVNYRSWLWTYITYENDYLLKVAEYIKNKDSKILYVLADDKLDNWEVKYEIPLHLKYIYGINMRLTDNVNNMKKGDVLLENTSLHVEKRPPNLPFTLLANNKYSVFEIEPLKFIAEVRKHPGVLFNEQWSYNTKDLWWWKIWEK